MKLTRRIAKIDGRQRLRYATMALGILALAPPVGFVVQLFGTTSMCGAFCMRHLVGQGLLTRLAAPTPGLALFFTWLGITLFFGRWMCSHVCPVGALTEFGSKAVPRRAKIDYARKVNAPLFRFGFLAAWVLLPMVGAAAISCAYCNFSSISDAFGAIFVPRTWPLVFTGYRLVSLIIYAVILGLFALDGRGHCHLVCPIGAVDSVVNWAAARLPFAWRERVQISSCSGCGVCARECPAAAITVGTQTHKASIDHLRCYQCRRCEGACARDAIRITRPEAAREALRLPDIGQGEVT